LHAQTAAAATVADRVFVTGACYPCGSMRDWSRRESLTLAGKAGKAGRPEPAAYGMGLGETDLEKAKVRKARV
jgi:hypothetical protein